METKQYANEKLNEAVYILCTHPGNIKERVTRAFDRPLTAVETGDFAKEDLQDWNYIKENIDNADEETYVEIAEKLHALSCKYD